MGATRNETGGTGWENMVATEQSMMKIGRKMKGILRRIGPPSGRKTAAAARTVAPGLPGWRGDVYRRSCYLVSACLEEHGCYTRDRTPPSASVGRRDLGTRVITLAPLIPALMSNRGDRAIQHHHFLRAPRFHFA